MWLKKLISNFFASAAADPEWERLRLQITVRLLKLLIALMLLIAVRNSVLGLVNAWIALFVAGLAGLVLRGLLKRPDRRRASVWALVFSVAGLMVLAVRNWVGPPPAASLIFVPLLALLGAVLDGTLLSATLLGLGLGILAYGSHLAGAAGPQVELTLGILGAASLGLFASILAWEQVLQRGLAELHASRLRLSQSIDERQALTFALFGGLAKALNRLRQELHAAAAAPLDWKRVHEAANEVRQRMEEVRQFRQSLPSEQVHGVSRDDFARSVMVGLLWVGLALSAAGWAYYLVTRSGAGWQGPLAMLVLGWGLFTLRGGRAPGQGLRLLVSLLGPFIVGVDALTSRTPGLPPTLHFWMLCILNTGLLLNVGAAVVVTGLGLLLLTVLLVDPNMPLGSLHLASNLAASWGFGLFIILQALVWQRDLLTKVGERGQAIATSLRLRRRLLGTFFHDLANPLNAVLAAAELGRAGLGSPADAQRAQRLCERMLELLGPSQDLLLDDVAIPAERLSAVELQSLTAAMHELYADRLTAKPVLLVDEVPAALSVRAVPSMLRDSVLSNLLSNAIKFSQPGGQVELDAWTEGEWVVMAVRDRGPGLPAAALAALAQGHDLPSLAGSSGEQGQGLGLALASEHLLRQGGRLELKTRVGGGTEALIWLPAA